MRDKKFAIALTVIVVLALALVYITLVGPKIQGYIINSQIEAQQEVVNGIIQFVNQQGYIILGQGESAVVLVRSPELEQQLQPVQQQVQQPAPEGFE